MTSGSFSTRIKSTTAIKWAWVFFKAGVWGWLWGRDTVVIDASWTEGTPE